MIDRVLVLSLAGSTLFGALLLLEWDSGQPAAESPVAIASPRPAETTPRRIQNPRVEELVATTLSRPLFSSTRRPRDRAIAGQAADPEFQLRLSGIVIEPERRIAIFARTGAKPLVRSEGETLDEWRLDSISPREVTLTGPTGSTTLQPKTDPNIARPAPPQAQPQPQAQAQAGRPAVNLPRPPVVAGRPGAPAPVAVPPRAAQNPPVRAPNPAPGQAPAITLPRLQR
jgi:general secretion pathway protein N